MQLRIVPASRGALWVRQGFRAFFAKPLSFMGLFGVVLVGMLVAQVLPWVGPVLFWASLPLVTLAFMLGTQQVLQGHSPTPQVFVTPLRSERARALWQLGALYAGAMVVVAAVYAWIDGGRSQALQAAAMNDKVTPEALKLLMSDPRLQLSFMWFAFAASVVSLPFWHAPALVYWGGQSVGKAMFFSTVACWRNKGAFAVYAFTGFGAILAFALASSVVFALLGQPNLVALAMMPAALVFTAVFYASLFFTFADCFEMPAAAPASEPEPTP